MTIMVNQGTSFQGFDPECHGGGGGREVGLGGEGQPLHGPYPFDMVSLEIIFILIIDVELVSLDKVLSGLIISRWTPPRLLCQGLFRNFPNDCVFAMLIVDTDFSNFPDCFVKR